MTMAQALIGLRPPRAILFDWDNTLVDTWATIHDALNFLMRAMEPAEWSLAETRERVRLSLREAFPLYFGERWEEARDRRPRAQRWRSSRVCTCRGPEGSRS